MFKAGDQLRQDILTLQILRVNKIRLESPKVLNLNLLPYNVVSTFGKGQYMALQLAANQGV